MNEAKIATELVRRIVAGLVIDSTKVKIECIEMKPNFIIRIAAPTSEAKRIIGNLGYHINAIKTIVRSISSYGIVDNVEFLEEKKWLRFPDFKPVKNWPKEEFNALLRDIGTAVFASKVKVLTSDSDSGGISMANMIIPKPQTKEVEEALKALAKSIAKKMGRLVTLNFVNWCGR